MKETPKIGIVVIGLNEGARLERCLRSVMVGAAAIVYVDSGSTDGSVSLAKQLRAEVVELDTTVPFTAARGRNAGFDRLRQICPDVEYVCFIDGDCEMHADWLGRAYRELDHRDDAAIVCGRLRERFPDRSLYNRLADLEWDCPAGDVESCGGIFVTRARAFEDVGKFDPSIAAGEEPELCWRLRQAKWRIVRLTDDMARHDLAMYEFSQWWQREIRLGHGGFDVWSRTGKDRHGPFADSLRSAWRWGGIWPVATLGASLGGWLLGGMACGVAMLVLGLLAWLAQAARMMIRGHKRGLSWPDSMAYGFLNLIGKWGQLYGRLKRTSQTRDNRAELSRKRNLTRGCSCVL